MAENQDTTKPDADDAETDSPEMEAFQEETGRALLLAAYKIISSSCGDFKEDLAEKKIATALVKAIAECEAARTKAVRGWYKNRPGDYVSFDVYGIVATALWAVDWKNTWGEIDFSGIAYNSTAGIPFTAFAKAIMLCERMDALKQCASNINEEDDIYGEDAAEAALKELDG